MTPSQAIGYTLNQTSSITAIVSTRIYGGMRPAGSSISIMPCINYFEIGGGVRNYAVETKQYSINCRAATAETALQIARLVFDLFGGTSGTGIRGTTSSFTILRASVRQAQGLIPEPDDLIYNAPVDVQLVFPAGTVS